MPRSHLPFALMMSLTLVAPSVASAPGESPDERARQTESRMTDDERFGLVHSLMIIVFTTGKRDERVPAEVPQIAGWVKGVPRLGYRTCCSPTRGSASATRPAVARATPQRLRRRRNSSARPSIRHSRASGAGSLRVKRAHGVSTWCSAAV